jgi:hypothetical protein
MMRSSGVYSLVILFFESSTAREIPISGYLQGAPILMKGLNTEYEKKTIHVEP